MPAARSKWEFRVKLGTASKRADLIIFPEDAPHKQEHAWAIIECKAPSVPPRHRTEGVDQLKSYMAGCVNGEFGMWTNGQERFCYRRVTENGTVQFVEISDIPEKGKTLDETERPSFVELRPATSDVLLFTIPAMSQLHRGKPGTTEAGSLLGAVEAHLLQDRRRAVERDRLLRDLERAAEA